MIRLLVVLIIAGVAAFFTNPKADAYRAPASHALQAMTDEALEGLDIGAAAESGMAQLGGGGDYETFYVASKYSAPSAEHPVVQCWGAFTMVRCGRAAEQSASGG